MRLWLALLPAVLLGCEGRDQIDTGETDDPNLPVDHFDELEYHEECYGIDDIDVPGATSYWIGELEYVAEDELQGYEYWALMTNPAWRETGEVDGELCVVAWESFAVLGDPVSCGTCDFSVTLDAYIDTSVSDCPSGLWKDEESYSVTYDVRVTGEDSAWYFSASGDPLGEGKATKHYLTYISDPTCVFF